MSRVDAAAADRLPWLSDEPAPRKPVQLRGNVLALALAAILLVAMGAFFVGVRSIRQPVPAGKAPREMTAPLPEARPAPSSEVRIPANPEVQPVAEPQVRPAPTREVRIAVPALQRTRTPQHSAPAREPPRREAPTKSSAAPQAVQPVAPPPAAPYVLPRPWPPRVISGASGRLVQIGAFGSAHQAKRGWWFMVRAYPAVAHLPAIVTAARNSRGRSFYRFQVGTTSQAHSEVLCQRMRMISLSCAVVGLPWQAKVER